MQITTRVCQFVLLDQRYLYICTCYSCCKMLKKFELHGSYGRFYVSLTYEAHQVISRRILECIFNPSRDLCGVRTKQSGDSLNPEPDVEQDSVEKQSSIWQTIVMKSHFQIFNIPSACWSTCSSNTETTVSMHSV